MRLSLYILAGFFAVILAVSAGLMTLASNTWAIVILWIVAALAMALGALTFTAARYMPAAQKRRS